MDLYPVGVVPVAIEQARPVERHKFADDRRQQLSAHHDLKAGAGRALTIDGGQGVEGGFFRGEFEGASAVRRLIVDRSDSGCDRECFRVASIPGKGDRRARGDG